MQSLPFVLSFAVAVAMVPAGVRALRERGLAARNYRGRLVAFPGGVAMLAASVVALIPLALIQQLGHAHVFRADARMTVTYVIAVALLGLMDDLVGARGDHADGPRGWRGHGRALLSGRLSTGALKAAGALGVALFVLSGRGLSAGDYLLAAALLVLATNLFNLLDLRPGRSAKALVLLGAGLTIGSTDVHPLWTVGLFAGPVLVMLPLDLRERAMLGDTGSNAIGAVAGVWLVLTLSTLGQAIALALIAVATVYGEFRSISALIERTPILRQLDSLGRASHA